MFNSRNHKKAVVVDLDGTISDNRHRLHHAKKGEWVQYTAKVLDDQPIKHAIETVNAFAILGYKIIIFTGRDVVAAKDTIEWLEHHKVTWHEMEMRKSNDFTPNHELKQRWLRAYSEDYDFALALEDDEKVAEMWINAGIPVLRVQKGD